MKKFTVIILSCTALGGYNGIQAFATSAQSQGEWYQQRYENKTGQMERLDQNTTAPVKNGEQAPTFDNTTVPTASTPQYSPPAIKDKKRFVTLKQLDEEDAIYGGEDLGTENELYNDMIKTSVVMDLPIDREYVMKKIADLLQKDIEARKRGEVYVPPKMTKEEAEAEFARMTGGITKEKFVAMQMEKMRTVHPELFDEKGQVIPDKMIAYTTKLRAQAKRMNATPEQQAGDTRPTDSTTWQDRVDPKLYNPTPYTDIKKQQDADRRSAAQKAAAEKAAADEAKKPKQKGSPDFGRTPEDRIVEEPDGAVN